MPDRETHCEKTEKQVCEEFDNFIESTKLFIIEKEVVGKYLFGANGAVGKQARIDRILVPTLSASRDRGLCTGPIGVEIKAIKTDQKWGPPICQAMDYRTASFRIFSGGANIDCVLDSIFLFPMQSPWGPIESIMAQHRIGFAVISWDTMRFRLSSTNVLELKRGSNEFRINRNTDTIGRSCGSR